MTLTSVLIQSTSSHGTFSLSFYQIAPYFWPRVGGPSKGGASNNEHPSTAYDQEIEEALFSLDRQKNNIQEE